METMETASSLSTLGRLELGVRFIIKLDTFPLFIGYILMIVLSGQWKKFTKPLNLRPVLVVYNLTASAISAYTLLGFAYGLMQSKSSFEAAPSSHLLPVYKIYWMTKVFELLDTVFMILRHRSRQISLLHVYHHSSMLLLSDLGYHYYPYPAMAPYLALNSAVHVMLYLYYGLCALYPNKPPEWKKFLTQFQIIQFALDLVHATIGYIYYTYCIYGILYGLSMLSLFSHFYYQAYVKKKSPKLQQTNETNGLSSSVNGERKKLK